MEVKNDYLAHHGILNQKWGVRNGPPYPLKGGAYSVAETNAIRKARKRKNSIYNKRHFDETLSKDKTVLSTLSYDPNRTKNVDMFYATHYKLDKHQYNALFNSPIPKPVLDENGNVIGTSKALKFRIDNKINRDLKVASEDSGAKILQNLYSKDRDFFNFLTDESRMQSYFVSSKYKFKGYREARDVLKKFTNPDFVPSSTDLQKVYRMFNYVIPYDGAEDARKGHDVEVQRAKFFKECKNAGYGAILDTNDAIYGGFKARSPVIVIDMEAVIPDKVKQTTVASKHFSEVVLVGRKVLGV